MFVCFFLFLMYSQFFSQKRRWPVVGYESFFSSVLLKLWSKQEEVINFIINDSSFYSVTVVWSHLGSICWIFKTFQYLYVIKEEDLWPMKTYENTPFHSSNTKPSVATCEGVHHPTQLTTKWKNKQLSIIINIVVANSNERHTVRDIIFFF